MPQVKTLRGPNGMTKKLTIPDGATQEQVNAAVQQAIERMKAEAPPSHIVPALGEATMGRVVKPVARAALRLAQPPGFQGAFGIGETPEYVKAPTTGGFLTGAAGEMGHKMLDLGTVVGTAALATNPTGRRLLAGGITTEAVGRRLGWRPELARAAGTTVELGGALGPHMLRSTAGAVRRAGTRLVRDVLPRVSNQTRGAIGREYRAISDAATGQGLTLDAGDAPYEALQRVLPDMIDRVGEVALPRRDLRALIQGVGYSLRNGWSIPYANLERTRRWLNAVRPRGQYNTAPVPVEVSHIYDTLTDAMRHTLGKSGRSVSGELMPPAGVRPPVYEGTIPPGGPQAYGPQVEAAAGAMPSAAAPPGMLPPTPPPQIPGPAGAPATGPMAAPPGTQAPNLVEMFDNATARWRDEVVRMAQPLMKTRHRALREGGGAKPVLEKADKLAKSRVELGDPGAFRTSRAPIDRVAKMMAKMDRAANTAPNFLSDPLVRAGGIIGAIGAGGSTPYQIVMSQTGGGDRRGGGHRQVKNFSGRKMLVAAAAGGLLGASAGRLGTLLIRGMRIPAESQEGIRLSGLIMKEIGRLESHTPPDEEDTP